MDLVKIGKYIAEKRKALGMTQKQLAEKLNISVRHCSAIECGNARLSIEKLIEVADLFHVTLDYLILGRRSSNKYIDLFPVCRCNSSDDCYVYHLTASLLSTEL